MPYSNVNLEDDIDCGPQAHTHTGYTHYNGAMHQFIILYSRNGATHHIRVVSLAHFDY